MKLAYYIKKARLRDDDRVSALISRLSAAGMDCYEASFPGGLVPGTDLLLSLGGDGTFLAAAQMSIPAAIPVLGINFGRLGFLSEPWGDGTVDALLCGDYVVEERSLLEVGTPGMTIPGFVPYALNEISVSRVGPAMLGVDVTLNGRQLPTYWADGLLVATSSGSTAYSLSVGGPICLPESKVLIVAPVSPHNLNVRPLIVPEDSVLGISFRSRAGKAVFTMDNRNHIVPEGTVLDVRTSARRLRRVRLGDSNFIDALRGRLLWGADIRNSEDK